MDAVEHYVRAKRSELDFAQRAAAAVAEAEAEADATRSAIQALLGEVPPPHAAALVSDGVEAAKGGRLAGGERALPCSRARRCWLAALRRPKANLRAPDGADLEAGRPAEGGECGEDLRAAGRTAHQRYGRTDAPTKQIPLHVAARWPSGGRPSGYATTRFANSAAQKPTCST